MVSANLNIHFSPSTRQTCWVELRSKVSKLGKLQQSGKDDDEELMEEVEGLLDFLDPLESLWAYPGRAKFDELLELFAARLYRSLVIEVAEINDSIESRGYRQAAIEEVQQKVSEDVHYFEVLVVGHISGREEDYLSRNLHRWRSNQDKFVYRVVVVPTMAEALVAVLLNYDIQSVIVHDDFSIQPEQQLLELAGLTKLIDSEIELKPLENQSVVLGQMIHDSWQLTVF